MLFKDLFSVLLASVADALSNPSCNIVKVCTHPPPGCACVGIGVVAVALSRRRFGGPQKYSESQPGRGYCPSYARIHDAMTIQMNRLHYLNRLHYHDKGTADATPECTL